VAWQSLAAGRRWRCDIIQFQVLGLEMGRWSTRVRGRDFLEQDEKPVIRQIASDDAARDKELIASCWINRRISSEVPHVIGAIGFNAEEIGAVLGDVNVEISLLIVICDPDSQRQIRRRKSSESRSLARILPIEKMLGWEPPPV